MWISRVCAGERLGSAGLKVALTAALILSIELRLPNVGGELWLKGIDQLCAVRRGFGVLGASPAGEPGNDGGGQEDLEGVSGEEGPYGQLEGDARGLVRGDGEPGCSAGEVDNAAGRCGECGKGEGRRSAAAVKLADQRCREGIGEQVSAGGAHDVEGAYGGGGREDRKAGGSFNEIGKERGEGYGGVEKQAEQKDGHWLESEGNGSKEERERDMRGDGEQGASEEDGQEKSRGPGGGQPGRCDRGSGGIGLDLDLRLGLGHLRFSTLSIFLGGLLVLLE